MSTPLSESHRPIQGQQAEKNEFIDKANTGQKERIDFNSMTTEQKIKAINYTTEEPSVKFVPNKSQGIFAFKLTFKPPSFLDIKVSVGNILKKTMEVIKPRASKAQQFATAVSAHNMPLLSKIGLEDVNKKTDHYQAAVSAHANLQNHVTHDLLKSSTPAEFEKKLNFHLNVAEKLVKAGDLNSAQAIVLGLSQNNTINLYSSRNPKNLPLIQLSDETKGKLESLNTLFSPENNFAKLRSLANQPNTAVPLSLLAKDLEPLASQKKEIDRENKELEAQGKPESKSDFKVDFSKPQSYIDKYQNKNKELETKGTSTKAPALTLLDNPEATFKNLSAEFRKNNPKPS